MTKSCIKKEIKKSKTSKKDDSIKKKVTFDTNKPTVHIIKTYKRLGRKPNYEKNFKKYGNPRINIDGKKVHFHVLEQKLTNLLKADCKLYYIIFCFRSC